MIWPAHRLNDSNHYIVAIRYLKHTNGTYILPSIGFKALRFVIVHVLYIIYVYILHSTCTCVYVLGTMCTPCTQVCMYMYCVRTCTMYYVNSMHTGVYLHVHVLVCTCTVYYVYSYICVCTCTLLYVMCTRTYVYVHVHVLYIMCTRTYVYVHVHSLCTHTYVYMLH